MSDSDISTAALTSFLTSELGVTVTDIEVLADGLNLVLELSTEADDSYILRQPRKLRHTSYINNLNREYGVMELLAETQIPAPEPVLFCADESVLGEQFFVMTTLDGEVVHLGSELPPQFRTERARERVGEALVETLADIHSLNSDRFAGVCERHSPTGQVERSLDRLDDVTSATGLELPRLRTVGDWLLENAPPAYDTTLLHGDFRPGNVLFGGREEPEVTGVLDWETALLGDPLTELGYLLLRWRDKDDPQLDLSELEARYSDDDVLADLRRRNEHGLAPFTGRPGSPSRKELVVHYERQTGRSFEHGRFYRTHAAFLLATVWADLHRHHRERGAESDWPPYIEYMSLLAESIASDGTNLKS